MDKISTVDLGMQMKLQSMNAIDSSKKAVENQDVKSKAEVEKASKGFEALLLHEMLKSMWATVDQTGLMGETSNEAQIYQDMFTQAIADKIAEGSGIGVQEFLAGSLEETEKK